MYRHKDHQHIEPMHPRTQFTKHTLDRWRDQVYNHHNLPEDFEHFWKQYIIPRTKPANAEGCIIWTASFNKTTESPQIIIPHGFYDRKVNVRREIWLWAFHDLLPNDYRILMACDSKWRCVNPLHMVKSWRGTDYLSADFSWQDDSVYMPATLYDKHACVNPHHYTLLDTENFNPELGPKPRLTPEEAIDKNIERRLKQNQKQRERYWARKLLKQEQRTLQQPQKPG